MALSISTQTLPCSLVLHQLHLRHLELIFSGTADNLLETYLSDVSCCLTLESLIVFGIDLVVEPNNEELPSMHLQSMPRLRHVRLVDSLSVRALYLPAKCSLFLVNYCVDEWPEHCHQFCGYTTVLWLRTDNTEWPSGLQGFSHLNYLELCAEYLCNQDLADVQHLPHVRVVSYDQDKAYLCHEIKLQLTSGSWQSFEVFFLVSFT